MQHRGKDTPPLWMTVCTVALAALMLAASVVLRAPREDYVYVNQDATWHVLHTMHCYDGIDAAEHLFLPLVTPNDDARGLVWGATVQSESGISYYTSFWPSAFLLAWGFARLTGLPYTPLTLYILNSILYVLCATFLALAMARLLRGRLHPCFAALACVALFCFQPEVLQSLGAVYWHQSLTQVVLAAQLLCFACFSQKAGKAGFFLCCLLAPLCEWSGLVANAGYAALLLFWGVPGEEERRPLRRRLPLSAGVGAATLAALSAAVFHYTRRVSLSQLFGALGLSYSVRGDSDWDPFLQYLVMLFRSHRPLWTAAAAALLAVLAVPAARRALPALLKATWPWLALTAFPLLENLVLRQHAVEYTYDRMKAATPLVLAFLLLCACLWQALRGVKWRRAAAAALAAGLVFLGAFGLYRYLQVPSYYVAADVKQDAAGRATFNEYLTYNRLLAERLLALYPRGESFYGIGLQVRGYTNILFQGGLLEMADLEETVREGAARGKRYIVFLETRGGVSSTYRFLNATVLDTATGRYIVHDPWYDYDYATFVQPE